MSLRRLLTHRLIKPNLSNSQSAEGFSIKLYHRKAPEKKKEDYRYKKNQDEPIPLLGWFTILIPISTFALGTWQVRRRQWKLQLLKDLHDKVSADPVDFPEDPQELENMEYRPVRVKGEFLYDKEIKIGPKSLIVDGCSVSEKTTGLVSTSSSAGFWIVTPFKLADRDETILINRGWVKSRRGRIPERELGHVPGVFELTGIVRLNEERPVFMPKNSEHSGQFVYRDLRAMSHITGASPIFLDLVARDGIPGGPIAGQTRISIRNEHMSYLITWYTLSALTSLMWYRLYIRKVPLW